MKHNSLYSILILTALLAASCEVDFSPNAPYRETPVVYCLLDQDDDTTWVRVERCFLEEGSIYNYGSDGQLYNYPQGRVTDHRIGMTLYSLEQFLDGDMLEMLDALALNEQNELLKGSQED